eukprot:1578696-Prymnesium_polylepis.1
MLIAETAVLSPEMRGRAVARCVLSDDRSTGPIKFSSFNGVEPGGAPKYNVDAELAKTVSNPRPQRRAAAKTVSNESPDAVGLWIERERERERERGGRSEEGGAGWRE